MERNPDVTVRIENQLLHDQNGATWEEVWHEDIVELIAEVRRLRQMLITVSGAGGGSGYMINEVMKWVKAHPDHT